MCKTRTSVSKKHFLKLNHPFMCWSPKSPMKGPLDLSDVKTFRGPSGDVPSGIACHLGSFFPILYMICLVVFVLERLTILHLKPPSLSLIGLGIYLINWSNQVFLIGLNFFISFRSNLSISSVDTISALKNSSSISLLIFSPLSFNSISFSSIKHFSNSKRLFFTFKNWFFI